MLFEEILAALSSPEPTEGLRTALEPFANAWTAFGDKPPDETTINDNRGAAYLEGTKITFGDLRRAHAALRAMPLQDHAAEPKGWKLVPAEPTREMRRAFHAAQDFVEEGGNVFSPDYQWKKMLAAAPAMVAEQQIPATVDEAIEQRMEEARASLPSQERGK